MKGWLIAMSEKERQIKLDVLSFNITDIYQYIVDVLTSTYPDVITDKDIILKEYRTNGDVRENSGAIYFYKVRAFGIEYLKSSQTFKIIFPIAYLDFLPASVVKIEYKSSDRFARIDVSSAEDLQALNRVIIEIFEGASTKDIGCCSSYLECSDFHRCVNRYPSIFLHCSYRKNLNKGIIFYGKNKTQ